VVLVQILDNSIYQCKRDNGDRTLPKKGRDGKYHAEGELCVVNRDTLRELFSTIQPILRVSRNFQCIMLTPLPRYLWTRCCSDPNHITNSEAPGFAAEMGKSLHELNKSLKNMIFMRKLKNISLLNSLEALGIVPPSNSPDDDEGRIIALWGPDPIHPTSAAYRELATKVASKATDLLNAQSCDLPGGNGVKRKPEPRDPWITGSQSVAKRLDSKKVSYPPRGHGGHRGNRGSRPPHRPLGRGRWFHKR
jgi:hypothetical protein